MSEPLRQRLKREGIVCVTTNDVHPAPSDIRQLLMVMNEFSDEDPLWVVLDGYHFDAPYHLAVCQAGARLMVIDDMAHLTHYHADIILNQNISASELTYSANDNALLLLGLDYVLLHDEFTTSRLGEESEVPSRALRLLVTIGGSDSKDVTGLVLEALLLLNDPDLEVTLITGHTYAYCDTLRKRAAQAPFTVKVIGSVNDMHVHMASADLVVSAAGTTCWEAAYMGKPALLFAWVDNQLNNGHLLHERGVVEYLGWSDDATPSMVMERIGQLVEDQATRAGMAKRGRELIDGLGRDRVLKVMDGFSC
jgi:UDP-2,4-diacetamido-2,4,6-trideoxy-beta-L-altropyranose hydrolase